jgi:ethanolamine ammonia-lyase large subunit
MITANQVKELQERLQQNDTPDEVHQILKKIVKQVVDGDADIGYVGTGVDYIDERVDHIVCCLRNLGYFVETVKYPSEPYTSITVRF